MFTQGHHSTVRRSYIPMTDFVMTLQRDLEEDMSWMEWTSVLKLSQMWKMKLINDLGLQKIPGRIHNLDQWIAALKISTQFRIQGLREIAIEELTNKLNSLNKVELAIE